MAPCCSSRLLSSLLRLLLEAVADADATAAGASAGVAGNGSHIATIWWSYCWYGYCC